MDWDGGVDLDPEEWERRNFEQDLSDRYRRLSSTVKMLPTEEDQLGYLLNSLAMADLLLLPKAMNLLSSSEYTEMVRREGFMTNSLKAFKKSIVLQVRQIRKAGSAGEDPGDKESDSMGSPQLLRLYTPKEMQKVVSFFKEMVNRGWIEVESSDQVHARITNAEGSHLVTEGHPPFNWIDTIAKLKEVISQMAFKNREMIPDHFNHKGRPVNLRSLASGGNDGDKEKHKDPVRKLAQDILRDSGSPY